MNVGALLRAEAASRTGELQYQQALRGIMRGLCTATVRGIEPALSFLAGARMDVTSWGLGVEERLRGFIEQLESHVAPAFDSVSNNVARAALATQTEMLGGQPQSSGVAGVIFQAKRTNIELMIRAGETYADDITKVLDDPATWDLTVEELLAVLQERGDVAMRHAVLIARDQVYKLNAEITRTFQINSGIETYWWRTCRDERVRQTHRANEGRTFHWSYPSPITGHPGHDPNCRCLAIPILPCS